MTCWACFIRFAKRLLLINCQVILVSNCQILMLLYKNIAPNICLLMKFLLTLINSRRRLAKAFWKVFYVISFLLQLFNYSNLTGQAMHWKNERRSFCFLCTILNRSDTFTDWSFCDCHGVLWCWDFFLSKRLNEFSWP